MYFDSMNNQTPMLMQPLRSYIEHSYIDRKLPPEHKEHFTEKNFWHGFSYDMMPSYQPYVPRQNNSFDCGLFLLEYAEIFAEDSEFIQSNLRQTGVELFKDEWIDMKRDVLKRLIISLATNQGDSPEEIGKLYSKWRASYSKGLKHIKKELRLL